MTPRSNLLSIAFPCAVVIAIAGCVFQPPPTASPSVPVPSQATETPPAALDPGWLRIDLGIPPSVSLNGAYAGPQGLVILGGAFGEAGSGGFTWTSPDGATWTLSPTPGQLEPSLGTALGDLEVIVGGGEISTCAHPFGETTWARRSGGRWLAAPFQDVFCAGGQPILTAGDGRFVIAGSGTGDQPFAWWSVDGLAWHDVPPPVDPFPLVRGVTFDGGEFWMIARGETDLLARTSSDGVTWTPWSGLAGTEGADAVTLLPMKGTPLVLTTGAGASILKLGLAGGAPVVVDVLPVGQAVDWAMGYATPSGRLYLVLTTGATRTLTSVDGANWDSVSLPPIPGFTVTGIADDGTHLLILGSVSAADGSNSSSGWLGTSPTVH